MNQQYVGSATNPRRDASLRQPPPPLHPCSSLVPIHTPSTGEAQRKKVSCPRTKHNEYAGSQNQICGARVQSALTIKPLPLQHENCFMSV